MGTASGRRRLIWGGLMSLAFVAVAVTLGLTLGSAHVPLGDLWALCTGQEPQLDTSRTILYGLRGPRVILGLLVGASLSLAGCGFQGIMRNPLADPYIVGTSAGASLGASLAIVCHLVSPWPWLSPIPACAFIGAMLSMLLVYRLARWGNGVAMETFLLAGVVVGSFSGAIVSFLMTCAGRDLQNVVLWLMGSLGQADAQLIYVILPYACLGGIALLILGPALNLISMGEESAASLGLDVERCKLAVIISASLVTAAAVAVAGVIGFIGLFIPHMVRMTVGPDHRILLPLAALNGAAFLVLADLAARTIIAPRELPVGVLTALVGAPFFFWLLRRSQHK